MRTPRPEVYSLSDRILMQIADHGPLAGLDFIDRLGVHGDATAVYRACRIMRDQELLTAHDDPRDGRAVMYRITDAGRAALTIPLDAALQRLDRKSAAHTGRA